MDDIRIPGIVKEAGEEAVDAFKERIAICIVEAGLTESQAMGVAMKDFRQSLEDGAYSGLT